MRDHMYPDYYEDPDERIPLVRGTMLIGETHYNSFQEYRGGVSESNDNPTGTSRSGKYQKKRKPISTKLWSDKTMV